MSKKRITIFTTSFLPVMGGLQYELKWLLDSMDTLIDENSMDLELHFLAPNKDALKYTDFKNIIVHDLGLKNGALFFINFFRLRKALGEIEPDLIHCQSAFPDAFMVYLNNLLSFKERKYIITSHGIDIVVLREVNYGTRLNPLINFLTKLALKKVVKHVLPSAVLTDFALEAGTKPDKIEIIPNGVNPLSNKSDNRLINQLQTEWGINKEKDLCLLCLSSTRPIKDLGNLIEGFALAKQRLGHLLLFLTCQDKTNTMLTSKIANLKLQDDVHFIGPIEGDIKDAYFRMCDVFCITSLFESFGLSALEAMEYGNVILATEVGGLKDFITDRYNGIFVKPKNPKDIADGIIEIYENKELREKVRENAKETVKQYYIENIAGQYLSLYGST